MKFEDKPKKGLKGLKEHWREDLVRRLKIKSSFHPDYVKKDE